MVQCFCEAGFFGDVETRPSGLQVRTCSRASGYTVPTGATFDNFLDAYNTTLEATGGTFKAGVAVVNGTDVEVAMAAQTTSWVAIGMRATAYVAPLLPHAWDQLTTPCGGMSYYRTAPTVYQCTICAAWVVLLVESRVISRRSKCSPGTPACWAQ